MATSIDSTFQHMPALPCYNSCPKTITFVYNDDVKTGSCQLRCLVAVAEYSLSYVLSNCVQEGHNAQFFLRDLTTESHQEVEIKIKSRKSMFGSWKVSAESHNASVSSKAIKFLEHKLSASKDDTFNLAIAIMKSDKAEVNAFTKGGINLNTPFDLFSIKLPCSEANEFESVTFTEVTDFAFSYDYAPTFQKFFPPMKPYLHLKSVSGHRFIQNNSLDNASFLTLAVLKGNVEITKGLLKNGADVNFLSKNGFSPLMLACMHHNSLPEGILEALLDANADPLLTDHQSNRTALQCAITHKLPQEKFKLLCDKIAQKTDTLLFITIAGLKFFDTVPSYFPEELSLVVKQVLKNGIDPKTRVAPLNQSLLCIMAAQRFPVLITPLIERISEDQNNENYLNEALWNATGYGQVSVVECLIKSGANITYKSTALECSAQNQTRRLIDSGRQNYRYLRELCMSLTTYSILNRYEKLVRISVQEHQRRNIPIPEGVACYLVTSGSFNDQITIELFEQMLQGEIAPNQSSQHRVLLAIASSASPSTRDKLISLLIDYAEKSSCLELITTNVSGKKIAVWIRENCPHHLYQRFNDTVLKLQQEKSKIEAEMSSLTETKSADGDWVLVDFEQNSKKPF